jgi:cystathionine gamma-synthase
MSKPVFHEIPLGEPIPGRPHSVSVSLPTLADIVGYEKGEPAVCRRIHTGYPRFVVHPLLRAYASEFAKRHKAREMDAWLVNSPLLAHEMVDHLGIDQARIVRECNLTGVFLPRDPALAQKAKQFLQHTGGFVSSREAEDALAEAGLIPKPPHERTVAGDPIRSLTNSLLPLFKDATDRDLLIFPSGMNALYAAFAGINQLRHAAGRAAWMQIGWLYLDTIEIFRKLTPDPTIDHRIVRDPTDMEEIRAAFSRDADAIAAVVVEAPSNPLVQTPDIPEIAKLCRASGALLIIDVSVASPFNVDALRFADLVVTSLTKYCACEGDVILGASVVNPASPAAVELRTALAARHVAPYKRDVARLAAEIKEAPAVVKTINASAAKVVEFLKSRPEVARVHWALEERSAKNYLAVARSPQSIGAIVSFELRRGIPLESFYDRVVLPKGPSFGMKSTLLSPHMYLAHFDLVDDPVKRAELEAGGPHPELLRLSVGTEPVEAIIESLEKALVAAARR